MSADVVAFDPHEPVNGSPFFVWGEFAVSRAFPSLVEPVPLELRANVERWVRTLGDPIRRLWGAPLPILSGYRSERLNAAVGGVPTSQHREAAAVDLGPSGARGLFRALLLRPNSFAHGQAIYYPRQRFVHLALPGERYPGPSFHVHDPQRTLNYYVVNDVREFEAICPGPDYSQVLPHGK